MVPDTKKIRILKTSEYTLIISEVGLRVWKSEKLGWNRVVGIPAVSEGIPLSSQLSH